MKILHTSDWHLGKRLEGFSRMDEQQAVMQEICDIAEEHGVDAVLVAGDLFDTFNPPTEAVELFYRTLKRLANDGKRVVICIAGNHDSPDRIEAPDPLARECGIIFSGLPGTAVKPFTLKTGLEVLQSKPGFIEIKVPNHAAPLRVLCTPFANEYRLRTFLGTKDEDAEMQRLLSEKWEGLSSKYCDAKGVNVLLSHFFIAKDESSEVVEPDDEKPIIHVGGSRVIYCSHIPDKIQYAAFGHLHRKQVVDKSPCPVVYSGSPLSYSFSEANQDKHVVLVEAEPGKPASINTMKLKNGKRLFRKEFNNVQDATEWLLENPDTWVELILASDYYITAKERKQLHNTHGGITNIIPKITNPELLEKSQGKVIDLNQDMIPLFKEYFKHREGQEPNQDIMDLFNEVLAENKKL